MHYSVLQKELIASLGIKEDGIYVDATVGYAGDAKKILENLKRGYLFAFDADIDAVNYSNKELQKIGNNFHIFNTNFKNMASSLKSKNVSEVDGIIFDLGVSSPQIDEANRGFSFMHDGKLDMRMSRTGTSAKDVVNNYSALELTKIFYEYGEEKNSRVIANNIVKAREQKEITTTLELVEIIKNACGSKYFFLHHPERKIFQAIRIEVNDELKVLEETLPIAISLLKKGGRLAVISFHSLEDRIVKNVFKKYSEVNELVKGLPEIPEEYKPLIKLVNKKAILPSAEELKENSRSGSAKLRVVERI